MEASKRFQIKHNVTLRVIDKCTGKLISERKGHNAATNTLIEGVGHYLAGEGVLRQGYAMLSDYIPKYISLGTMGLYNQDEDSQGLPINLCGKNYTGDSVVDFTNYMLERPGYGADGYSSAYNNNRPYMGLGPAFTSYSTGKSYYQGDVTYYKGKAYVAVEDMIVDPDNGYFNSWDINKWRLADTQPTCNELISPTYPRQDISFRDVVPEYEAELPKTVDVIFSAMIPTGALDEFRDSSKDYIFITEAGLWAEKEYQSDDVGTNGLVAGYRLVPPNSKNWYMNPADVPTILALQYLVEQGITDPTDVQIEEAQEILAAQNRKILQEQILRVERDQVVQVVWKIQIGNLEIEDVDMSSGDVEDKIEDLYRLVADAETRTTQVQQLLESKVLYSSNVYISPSSWISSTGTSPYRYKANISINGIDSSYFSMVQFSDDADPAFTYQFSPMSTTSNNVVTIYAVNKPVSTILLPMIICYQGKATSAHV